MFIRAMLTGMKSVPVVLLLIVNLLTCPLRCLALESHVAASVESSCATCSCCLTCDEVRISDNSVPLDDDFDCKSCVCEGAVTEHSVELPESEPQLSWLLPLDIEFIQSAALAELVKSNALTWSAHSFSGRDARIAHQSWQI